MFKVIDTHTHFDAEEFDEDRAQCSRQKKAKYRINLFSLFHQ